MENNQKKLRMYWSSNAMFATSGYGQAMAELLPLIRDEGYPVAIGNFFGSQGGKFMLDGILNYPVINHVYGSDGMVLHGRDFNADVVFSLQDAWVLNPQDLQQVKRWIPHVPVDHDPISPPVIQNLKFAYRIIAMSKFGQKEMARVGFASTYIPHTVNTEVFTPMDKAQRKRESAIPEDCFLVGMVAANKDIPPRKSFQEVMDAFKMFLQKEPKALLYIHSNPEFPGGFNFKQYADFIGIGDRLLTPDVYQMNFNTAKENMAKIYNCFDVLVAPSISEGFGVPIIEALSCGVPVITTDFTAMSEHIEQFKNGYKVKVAYKRFSPQGSYMGIPDVADIAYGLEWVRKADREKLSKASREFALKNYDTVTIFKEKWKPFLQMVEEEVYGKAPNVLLDKTSVKTS